MRSSGTCKAVLDVQLDLEKFLQVDGDFIDKKKSRFSKMIYFSLLGGSFDRNRNGVPA